MADSLEEVVQRIQRGVEKFAAEMREKGIHVGLGPKGSAWCVCGKPWPCKGDEDD